MPGIVGHDPESPVRFEGNTPARVSAAPVICWLKLPVFFGGADASQAECAMRKIKDVLRLKFEAKLSHERIAAATGISKWTVFTALTITLACQTTIKFEPFGFLTN